MKTLTITTNPDWKSALRAAITLDIGEYQAETLNFETRAISSPG